MTYLSLLNFEVHPSYSSLRLSSYFDWFQRSFIRCILCLIGSTSNIASSSSTTTSAGVGGSSTGNSPNLWASQAAGGPGMPPYSMPDAAGSGPVHGVSLSNGTVVAPATTQAPPTSVTGGSAATASSTAGTSATQSGAAGAPKPSQGTPG